MSSCPACRPGLPALLPRPSAPLSATKRAVHRTRPAHSPFKLSSPACRRRARVISSCHGGMVERRLMLIPAISLTIGSLQYSLEKGAAKAEFTEMPALRGKDYGKTKMSYADYTKTESGLQYKDLQVGDGPSPKKGETTVNLITVAVFLTDRFISSVVVTDLYDLVADMEMDECLHNWRDEKTNSTACRVQHPSFLL
ncbi:uncharacterized protein LOC123405207 [Hordeum vulgare subsp. vulgare]|uniref:uncharacterized protein LOC123405207 n=1 Tax=Hordeum vulgare subsp. vulgare TaxID=112509 RepID=UPI001D1A3452|nr:uncharacterized protein LOC123405207 [Hordeum vulgare subsp. vulgare]